MYMSARQRSHAQRGLTLIEVLVALVICAFGVLGLAGLQGRAQQAEMEGYQRAQAVVLLSDMVERININSSNAASYVTGTSTPLGTGDSQPASCTSLTGVARDKCDWSRELKGAAEINASGGSIGAMIGARGCIEQVQAPNPAAGVCQPGIYRASISWQGLNPSASSSLACGQNLYGGTRRIIATQVSVGVTTCS
jgi:type IV pilus assembly protein PilV